MKQRKVTYVSIGEARTYYSHMPNGEQLELTHSACIQERLNDNSLVVRTYRCSEASILRLAKIQEKLAE